MNKLVLFLVCFISILFATSQPLGGVTISPWVGYATLTMEDVNTYLDEIKDDYETWMGVQVELTKFGSGYIAGLDIGMLRLGYIPTVTTVMEWEDVGLKNNLGFKSSLTMALIGFRTPNSAKSSVSFGIYAGYGLASVTQFAAMGIGTPLEISIELPFEGSDIVGEAILGINLGSLELGICYRYAVIKKVELPNSVGIDIDNDGFIDYTYPKGEVLEKAMDEPLVFDYSGITVSLGLRFGGKKPEPERIPPYRLYGQKFIPPEPTPYGSYKPGEIPFQYR